MFGSIGRSRRGAVLAIVVLLLGAGTATTLAVVYPTAGLVFGLATAPDGSQFVADAASGISEIRDGQFTQIVQLPGVTDVAPTGRGVMLR